METTAKTPWKDHLGDIPFSLEYFQGSMWEGIEKQADALCAAGPPRFHNIDRPGDTETNYHEHLHELIEERIPVNVASGVKRTSFIKINKGINFTYYFNNQTNSIIKFTFLFRTKKRTNIIYSIFLHCF